MERCQVPDTLLNKEGGKVSDCQKDAIFLNFFFLKKQHSRSSSLAESDISGARNGPDSSAPVSLVPDCSELAPQHSRYRLTTTALINGPFIVAFIGPLFPRQLRYPPDTSGAAAWGGGSG